MLSFSRLVAADVALSATCADLLIRALHDEEYSALWPSGVRLLHHSGDGMDDRAEVAVSWLQTLFERENNLLHGRSSHFQNGHAFQLFRFPS